MNSSNQVHAIKIGIQRGEYVWSCSEDRKFNEKRKEKSINIESIGCKNKQREECGEGENREL